MPRVVFATQFGELNGSVRARCNKCGRRSINAAAEHQGIWLEFKAIIIIVMIILAL